MAEAEYNRKYYTTYTTGANMYVTFGWERRQFDKPVNLWCETDTEPVLKEYNPVNMGFVDSNDIVYITSMSFSGSGDAYESMWEYELKETTDPYYSEYKNNISNEEINIPYGMCIFTGVPDNLSRNYICCIEEIIVDEGITSLGQTLNNLMANSTVHVDFPLAKYLRLPKTLQKTGSKNYRYLGIYQQECAFHTTSLPGSEHLVACKIDIYCTNLQYIGRKTFIKNVNILDNFHCEVFEIASEAFYYYDKIVNLDLGRSLKYVGKSAFSHCENLVSINEDNFFNCTCVESIFWYCNKIEFITLGNNVVHYGRDDYENNYIETTKPFIMIEYGKGSNLYKGTEVEYEGFQVVNVVTENKLFLEYYYSEEYERYIGTDWESGNVYVGSIKNTGFIHLALGSRIININSYSDGDIAILVGDKVKRVKIVETTDSSASPVRIALGNKIMALKY